MHPSTLIAAVSLLCLSGGKLATDYSKERALKIEVDSTTKMETETKMSSDGQPDDRGSRTSSWESERHIVQIDKVLAHEDGAPTKVKRKFVELKNSTTMSFGEDERKDDHDGVLAGVTLELERADKGDVAVKVVDGKADGAALEGHKLELALDALLPSGDEKEWDLDSKAGARALGFDVAKALFPPPEPPSDSGGGSGGGGGGGRSRGRGSMGGASYLQTAEWEGKAKLKDADEDYEGASCAVIEIELGAKGDLPEWGGGSSGRGRSFDPFDASSMRSDSTFEVSLKGKLLFDKEHKVPVHLELDGKLTTKSHMERKFGDRDMVIDSTGDGSMKYEVSVSPAKEE
jgi:hypothetical protein